MAWIYLLGAGLLEVLWASMMKQSDGLSRPVPTLIMLVSMLASFALLTLALRSLPLGTGYAIWTGIGAMGAFIVGVIAFGDALTLGRVLSVVLILTGIVGLKLTTGNAP
ncbi:sugE protein [Oceanicaulis alexandrii HTCC2633]|uniref:DMT family transporter n=1 Tax=Oceanicaulis sp. HTCC2633 TaxID=314254 RepID=UPI000066BC0F|nr:multidrug efflux SMR transporter [Oceanicaulis sp. HTCC2633]EAP89085.1 sugE protein [Oceanicaulis alexandrii HTCC2633] [Oceanicaulis sp. HTCC2633]